MKFLERLKQFGFNSYDDYLNSEGWKAFKDRYRAAGKPMRCAVCDGKPVQLHHHDYSRVCQELLGDVTPLCRTHHVRVHEILKENGWLVLKTGEVVRQLRGEQSPKPETKKPTSKSAARRQAKKRTRRREKSKYQSLNNFLKEDLAAKKKREKESRKCRAETIKATKINQREVREREAKKLAERWDDPVFLMQAAAMGIRRPARFR